MEVEVRELMNENEVMSHLFFNCLSKEQLHLIKEKYVGEVDWIKESCKVPIEMKIGGLEVNPKDFFLAWTSQMNELISKEATRLVSEKVGSAKMIEFSNRISSLSELLEEQEKEINWDVDSPLK